MTGVQIRLAGPADCKAIAGMAAELWPDETAEEHATQIAPALAAGGPSAYFIAMVDGEAAGFIEVGLRSHADGCDPAQPVGFLEGWYVKEQRRGLGIGGGLVRAAEEWARARGCMEMGSDTWLDHDVSQRAHQALGYEEVDRCVHYRKRL